MCSDSTIGQGVVMEKRSSFSSRIGFVMAAAGSAVGLGNIWRFPYLAAKYGGGIFILIYILLVVTFGFALMIAETAIGRKTGLSAIGAYQKLNKKFSFLGWLTAIVPVIILPYYCVIGGWVIKYLITFLTGNGAAAAGESYFSEFTATTGEPVIWLVVFLVATFAVVFLGVKRGIEKVNKVLMPLLILLTIAVAIYSVTLPGAGEGVAYYLTPDFSKLSVNTVLGAMGQMFYSMSLAMGIMITYGSYMKKDNDLEKSVKQIEWFDTGIAFLAGLMVIPAVFAFSSTSGVETAVNAGPSLMFVTLPKVFNSMGFGSVMGVVFFLLVLFAALTSSISMMEAIVSMVQDKFHVSRRAACIIVALITLILAVPSSLGFGIWSDIQPLGFTILDFFDFLSNSVLMPIVALFTCIFVGYVIKTKTIEDEVMLSSEFKRKRLFRVVIKYIAPIVVIAILVSSVLNGLGIITL